MVANDNGPSNPAVFNKIILNAFNTLSNSAMPCHGRWIHHIVVFLDKDNSELEMVSQTIYLCLHG